jgi:hypothetical protein
MRASKLRASTMDVRVTDTAVAYDQLFISRLYSLYHATDSEAFSSPRLPMEGFGKSSLNVRPTLGRAPLSIAVCWLLVAGCL